MPLQLAQRLWLTNRTLVSRASRGYCLVRTPGWANTAGSSLPMRVAGLVADIPYLVGFVKCTNTVMQERLDCFGSLCGLRKDWKDCLHAYDV